MLKASQVVTSILGELKKEEKKYNVNRLFALLKNGSIDIRFMIRNTNSGYN